MTSKNAGLRINRAFVLAMCIGLWAGNSTAQVEGTHSVMTDDPVVHLKEFQRKMDWMRERLKNVAPDPDAVADARAGGITLQQHAADIASMRDEFAKCVAALKKRIADKIESGTATDADKLQFDKCVGECESVLDKLNNLHLNATVLGSADHKTRWIVDGLAKHKKAVEETLAFAAKCPEMIHVALRCAEIKKDQTAASSQAGRGTHYVSSDEPIVHLKEFQRKLDWMATRLKEVQPDPDAAPDATAGGVTLQQHAADVADTRDEFAKCLASMKKKIADKEESGTATDADKAQFKKCVAHCESVLEKLNKMHLNATLLGSADHKTTWVVDGLAKHKKGVEELQTLAAQCPDMIQKTLECCKKH